MRKGEPTCDFWTVIDGKEKRCTQRLGHRGDHEFRQPTAMDFIKKTLVLNLRVMESPDTPVDVKVALSRQNIALTKQLQVAEKILSKRKAATAERKARLEEERKKSLKPDVLSVPVDFEAQLKSTKGK